MGIEVAILVWAAVGAGIAAGAFLVARAAVQLAATAYALLERRLDRDSAVRRGAALSLALVVALGITALIAAVAILALLGILSSASG